MEIKISEIGNMALGTSCFVLSLMVSAVLGVASKYTFKY